MTGETVLCSRKYMLARSSLQIWWQAICLFPRLMNISDDCVTAVGHLAIQNVYHERVWLHINLCMICSSYQHKLRHSISKLEVMGWCSDSILGLERIPDLYTSTASNAGVSFETYRKLPAKVSRVALIRYPNYKLLDIRYSEEIYKKSGWTGHTEWQGRVGQGRSFGTPATRSRSIDALSNSKINGGSNCTDILELSACN